MKLFLQFYNRHSNEIERKKYSKIVGRVEKTFLEHSISINIKIGTTKQIYCRRFVPCFNSLLFRRIYMTSHMTLFSASKLTPPLSSNFTPGQILLPSNKSLDVLDEQHFILFNRRSTLYIHFCIYKLGFLSFAPHSQLWSEMNLLRKLQEFQNGK